MKRSTPFVRTHARGRRPSLGADSAPAVTLATASATRPTPTALAQTPAAITRAPVTKAPVTKAPVTKASVTQAPAAKAPAAKAPAASPPNVSPLSLDPEVMHRASLWNEPILPPVTTQPVDSPPPMPLDLTPSEAAWLAHYTDAVTLAVAEHNATSAALPAVQTNAVASAPSPNTVASAPQVCGGSPTPNFPNFPSTPEPIHTPLEENVLEAPRAATPAWEVPAFDVPPVVEQLFGDATRSQLAKRLAAASAAGLRSLAVTSVSRGEGRTTVAIGLAIAAASAGLNVVLLDADTDGPSLAGRLRVEIELGWNEVGEGPITEAAVASVADGITLLPMRPENESPLRPSDLSAVIAECKSTADLIIVDLPASATAMAAVCDTTAVVRDASNADDAAVEAMALTLRRGGQQGIGVIENFCPPA